MKVIFLDFDGVMNTIYYEHILSKEGKLNSDPFGAIFDPECVKNLGFIIEKTGADIVVSSSWKYLMTYKDFLDMWEARNLPGFVTDVTPTPKIRRNRGDEIDAWLNECQEECQYVIIDDLDARNFNEHQLPNLLVVNPFNGLDREIAEKAIQILLSTTL